MRKADTYRTACGFLYNHMFTLKLDSVNEF